ncbi:AAA domain-containing protein, partial [Methanohalophilus sp.]
MDPSTKEIPWDQVIQFHREIVRLNHDSFFKLPYDYSRVNRWTPIDQDFFHNMKGPWDISYEAIVNPKFSDQIQDDEIIEAYIGGPCWVSNSRNNKNVYPFFYRTVYLELFEDFLRITPSEGVWEISPFVHDSLSRKEVDTDKPLEEIGNDIINTLPTKSKSTSSDIEDYLIDSLSERIPEINALIEGNIIRHKLDLRSSWTLFMPPLSSPKYNKHILKDYENLEYKISNNPSAIGGLNIFNPTFTERHSEEHDILPIIPLNDSQKSAVSEVFKSKPVTVISGPPGCGKSQVVTSLLLNAWANNISLLFSSTTNAAVDVVFDRLSSFESDYPVAIRAGSRTRNNIDEAFQKILNQFSFSLQGQGKETENMQQTRDVLNQKKQMLQSFLDNQTPQQITESLRSSLKAYSNYLKIIDQIETDKNKFANKIQLLGYSDTPNAFESNILNPLNDWLKDIDRVKKQIQINNQEKNELETKFNITLEKRSNLLNKLHINISDNQDFDWLLLTNDSDDFISWYDNFSSLLNSYTESLFSSYTIKDEYLEWGGKRNIESWMRQTKDLKNNISYLIENNSEHMNSMESTRIEFGKAKNKLNDLGLSEDENYNLDKLNKWNNQYQQLALIPSGLINILKRRKCKKDLEKTESEISHYFPINVLKSISDDEIIGRDEIYKHIQAILEWVKIKNKWNQQNSDFEPIDQQLRNCYSQARQLDLLKSGYSTDVDFWIDIIKYIESKANIARQALKAWDKKEEADLFFERINQNVIDFQNLINSNPIVNAWFSKEEPSFRDSMYSLHLEITPEMLSEIRLKFSHIRFDDFLNKWKEAIETEKQVQNYQVLIDEIKSKDELIESWWDRKPICSINTPDISKLPEEKDVLWQHFKECNELNEEWIHYKQTKLSNLIKEKNKEYNWAKDKLKEAVSKIPIPEQRSDIEKFIKSFIEQPDSLWPIDDLNDSFAYFDPEKIQEDIDTINSQLEDLSYSLAKRWWLHRIKKEAGTLECVENLYQHYRRHNYSVNDFSITSFRQSLNAVPVWVTTALSTQSIPLEADLFDILVIDEASQCTLTNILPLIYRAKRIVIIGDHNQLPAISEISNGKEQVLAEKYDISSWLHLISHNNDMYNIGTKIVGRENVTSLVQHYRSHPLIIGFSNQHIYHKQLRLMRSVKDSGSLIHSGVFGKNVRGFCKKGYNGKSWTNKNEADAICDLVNDLQESQGLENLSIGIVSPFAEQARMLEERINVDATVGTAHKLQGDERDIIIFSPVISKGMKKGAIKFANNENLVNVALTRAKKGLFVVGDFAFCKQSDGIVSKLINYVETVSLLRDTSREELELFSWMTIAGLSPIVHHKLGNIEVDFLLKKSATKLVVEVDGRQHYLVNVDGKEYNIHYEDGFYYIKIDDEKHFIRGSQDNEYVEINDSIYPVVKTEESIEIDNIRDQYLKSQGYKVLRVPTKAIRETPTNVMDNIKQELNIL